MKQHSIWQPALAGLATASLMMGATVAVAQSSGNDNPKIEDRLIQIAPEEGSEEPQIRPFPGEDRLIEAPRHWVGIGVGPVPELLRKHLQLGDEEGVLVLNVADDSPAAKAGIAKDDVIVSAAGKDLVELRDLLEVVRERGAEEFEVEVIHEGERTTLQITPAERPEEFAVVPFQPGEQGSRDFLWRDMPGLQNRLEQIWPEGTRLQFRSLGPGVIFDTNQLNLENLPTGVSVQVYKESEGPAMVKVQQGDQSWKFEADDEEALEELPEDVRGIVKGMLSGRRGAFSFAPAPGGGLRQGFDRNLGQEGQGFNLGNEEFEKRMQEMESRIEDLVEQLERLQSDE